LAHFQQLSSAAHIAAAWQWLVDSRKHFPANADIWHLRFHRASLLPRILDDLRAGRYQFSPLQVVQRAGGETIALWSAADAFVLKLLTLQLQKTLPLHRNCTHLRGHGGHKSAVRQAHNWISGGAYTFVCKTDIKGYYAHIDKHQLFELLAEHVKCPILLNLLGQFLAYSVEKGGLFHTPVKGIPRGCPLSPLLAGFHLFELDRTLSRRKGVRYLRFMDDLLIISQTRWQLKRAVAIMNQGFAEAGLEQHPDKTFIGRITHGFDWLGYHFAAGGLQKIARQTIVKVHTKLHRLYEQARRLRLTPEQTQQRAVAYIKRWRSWASAGLSTVAVRLHEPLGGQDTFGDGVGV
jgi:RNA-directed DNA polymerase